MRCGSGGRGGVPGRGIGRKRLQDREQRLRHFDPLRRPALQRGTASSPGRRTPGSSSIALTSASTRSAKAAVPRQSARVHREQHMAEGRAIALGGEEAVGFETQRGAGERGAEQFHHQRQQRALGAAGGQHRAAQRGLRVGGRTPLRRPPPSLRGWARPSCLALRILPRARRAERQVHHDRRCRRGAERRRPPGWCPAAAAAPRHRHGGGGVGEGQRHQPAPGQPLPPAIPWRRNDGCWSCPRKLTPWERARLSASASASSRAG